MSFRVDDEVPESYLVANLPEVPELGSSFPGLTRQGGRGQKALYKIENKYAEVQAAAIWPTRRGIQRGRRRHRPCPVLWG
jgi:hypothetical protein